MTQINPTPGDPTPNPIVSPGNSVLVTPKNPFLSTSTYGLLTMLIAAAASKYLPVWVRAQATESAIEILVFLVGLAAAAYGRIVAHRPLGFSQKVRLITVR